MPKRFIAVIAITFCLGVWGLVRSALLTFQGPEVAGGMQFSLGPASFDTSIFLLPIAIGLLRGRRSSRSWWTFWAALHGVPVIVVLVAALISQDVWVGLRGMQGPVSALFAVLYLSATAVGIPLAIWTLYTDPVAQHFTGETPRREDPQPV